MIEIRLFADARQHVRERMPPRTRVQRLVRRHQRHVARAAEHDQALEIVFLSPVEVTLDLDEAA